MFLQRISCSTGIEAHRLRQRQAKASKLQFISGYCHLPSCSCGICKLNPLWACTRRRHALLCWQPACAPGEMAYPAQVLCWIASTSTLQASSSFSSWPTASSADPARTKSTLRTLYGFTPLNRTPLSSTLSLCSAAGPAQHSVGKNPSPQVAASSDPATPRLEEPGCVTPYKQVPCLLIAL